MRSVTLAPYLNRLVGCLKAGLLPVLAVIVVAMVATPTRAQSIFFIRGGGDGHGIGMSQYGAYGYALHGKDYRFILAHYYRGTALGQTNPNRIVRVLLASGTATFSGARAAGATVLNPGRTYAVEATSSGRLQIVSSTGHRVGPARSAPLTVTGTGPLSVPGAGSYRGSLQFRPNGQGGVETVDAVSLDDYVRGVVAAEMPSSWSAQALDAQAVAARTYAITTTVGAQDYDLYDDTRSQMYGGVGAETTATDAAVATTRGQIVTYHGQPAVTYFFASSGGYTENIENVWPGAAPEPWLRGVPDPYDGAGGDPFHQWRQQMSLAAAAGHLHGLVKGAFQGIIVTAHGASPRILRALVIGSHGSTTVSGAGLQSAFGLATTLARFTTITMTASATSVSGTIVSGTSSGTVWAQQLKPGGWHTVAHQPLGTGGSYRLSIPGPGRYRVQYAHLGGPAVNAR